jgi:peptide deformylase
MNHTADMEKAMYQSHGIGYAEYERSLEKRLFIERKREKDYKISRRVADEFDQRAAK